ncbi:MAG: permease [Pseudomonadales bacterium]
MKLSGNLIYVSIAIAAAAISYALNGATAFQTTSASAAIQVVEIVPLLLGAMLLGGYFQALVPRATITRLLGGESGFRGLALAAGAGAVTPGGPFASFPLALALFQGGADTGTTVAFITSWSVTNLPRLFIWELPLLGTELAMVRLAVSLPLPIIAGYLARRLARHVAPIQGDAEPP